MKAILGEKLGMTQIFDEGSRAIPVTIIKAGPVHVTQIKRPESDGYAAIQIAYKELPERMVTKPVAVRYAWGMNPSRRNLLYKKEGIPASPFRTDNWDVTQED